jgi:hypothetical protein
VRQRAGLDPVQTHLVDATCAISATAALAWPRPLSDKLTQ